VLEGYGLEMRNEEAPFGKNEALLDAKAFGPEIVQGGIRSARFYRASPVVITDARRARRLVRAAGGGGAGAAFGASARGGKGEVVALGQALWWSWISAAQARGTDNAELLRWLLTKSARKNPGGSQPAR